METLREEVLAIGREALAEERTMIERVGTEEEADAELKAYLLRVVQGLEDLFEPGPADDGELRILAQALAAFRPVLDLQWLPSEARDGPELTQEQQERLDALRWERATYAAQRAARPLPDKWHNLIGLISESLELFMASAYAEGIDRCFELLDAVEAHVKATWAVS